MANLVETIPEIHTTWFVGKKLVRVTGRTPISDMNSRCGGFTSNNTNILAN